MSRRKQDKPQPRKRLGLVNSDADLLLQDLLTCGVCQKEFVLSDIVKFIQHKVHLCNKENYKLQNNYEDGDGDSSDHSGPDANADTKLRVSNKRPSISAPITRKSSLLAARLENRDPHRSSPSPLPTPVSVSGGSSNDTHRVNARNRVDINADGGLGAKGSLIGDLFNSSSERLRSRNSSPHTPNFFNSLHNRCRTASSRTSNNALHVDVCTNTTITEPTTLICSTCKSSFPSAWLLLQHAQNTHGLKIYLDTSSSLLVSSASAVAAAAAASGAGNCSNRSTPSASSVLGCLPSRDNTLASSVSSLAPFLGGAGTALDATTSQLLRVPLGERQFVGSSLTASALFSRPSSQDIGLISEHYSRLNSSTSALNSSSNQASAVNNGSLSITAAGGGGGGTTTSATGPSSLNPFDTHHAFEKIRVPPLGLSFEPQMDFYSQRLRQLAGATSPNTAALTAATPSPRKPTPPFGSGGSHHGGPNTNASSHSSSEPSTPTPSQQSKDHHAQSRNSSSSNEKEKPPLIVLRSSSPSSNGSKGGGSTHNDLQEGSPKVKRCEFCGKAFRFQSNLVVHRRSHTGEKPFKCEICQHACTQASKLKRHMKTHRNKSPGDSTISENTSMGSARSTPDSAAGGEGRASRDEDKEGGRNENGSRKRHREREADDGNNSDSQAVDIEDDDDMDEEDEEEELEPEDEDENSTDLIAEDLTTNKSVGESSNPADLRCNNKEPKSEPAEISSLASGGRHHHHEARQSVLGEVMEKIGLSNIQQYNEAYRQALEESFANSGVKLERPASSELILPNSPHENGPLSREEGNNKVGGSSAALDFGLSLARAFESPLEKNKRLKLDHHHHHHLRDNSRESRDSLYAGLWLPSVPSSHRDLYYGVSSSEPDLFRLKTTSESALKSVTPGGAGRFSPRPGTSGSGVSSLITAAAAAAAATSHVSLTFPGSGGSPGFSSSGGNGNSPSVANKPKTDRRNDTCEFCGKVFKNCSNLTVHRRSHTGEKPYKCELCSYACAQSSKLTRHMKTHGRVGKDVYRCRFCDMPFSVPSTLEKHMRKCVVNQNSSSGSALMDKDHLDYGKDDSGQPSNDGRASEDILQQYGRSPLPLLSGKDSSSYKDNDVLSICEQNSEESRDDSRRDSDNMKEELL